MTESEKLDLILVKLDKIDKLESEFGEFKERLGRLESCLLYTSDAADD